MGPNLPQTTLSNRNIEYFRWDCWPYSWFVTLNAAVFNSSVMSSVIIQFPSIKQSNRKCMAGSCINRVMEETRTSRTFRQEAAIKLIHYRFCNTYILRSAAKFTTYILILTKTMSHLLQKLSLKSLTLIYCRQGNLFCKICSVLTFSFNSKCL